MLDAFGCWPKNSVEDIIDMLLQMLEVRYVRGMLYRLSFNIHSFIYLKALKIIHDLNTIAHRVSNPC